MSRQTVLNEVAYWLWEARGCPIGSPEVDWVKAEQLYEQADDEGAYYITVWVGGKQNRVNL